MSEPIISLILAPAPLSMCPLSFLPCPVQMWQKCQARRHAREIYKKEGVGVQKAVEGGELEIQLE